MLLKAFRELPGKDILIQKNISLEAYRGTPIESLGTIISECQPVRKTAKLLNHDTLKSIEETTHYSTGVGS